jgi:hypothetical protein
LRRQDEGGFGQVELGRDRLHLLSRQVFGIGKNSKRIAAELPVGEHIDGEEFQLHGTTNLLHRQ